MYGDNLAAAYPANVGMVMSGVSMPVTSISDNELRAVLAPGVGRGHDISVVIHNRVSNPLVVDYGIPVITGFSFNVGTFGCREVLFAHWHTQ